MLATVIIHGILLLSGETLHPIGSQEESCGFMQEATLMVETNGHLDQSTNPRFLKH